MNPQFDQDTMQKIQQATAAGYDQNTVLQKAMQYQQQKNQAQQPQQQPDSGGGSILNNLLPLIGGIGGSALGSLAAPGIGTIAGGGIGAGLGQTLADILSHKTPTLQDVGGQAAAGTVGGVAGKALEPVFGLAGKVLSRFAPDALDNAGTGFIASQYNVPRSMARANDLKGTIDQLSKYGISNINDVVPHADTVIDTVNNLNRSAIAKAQPVDTTGLLKMAQDLVSTSPTTGDDKIINFVQKQIDAMNGGTEGSVETSAHPLHVFDAIKQLESKANEIKSVPKPARTTEAINTSQIYNQLANELKTRLFTGTSTLTPATTSEFAGETIPASIDAYGNPTKPFTFPSTATPATETFGGGADNIVLNNPILANSAEYKTLANISPQLANDVAMAKTVGERRAIMSHFVRGSNLANETEAGSQIGFNNVGGAVKGVAKGMPTLANPLAPVQQLLGTNAVNAGAGQALKGVAGKMAGIPMPSGISPLLAKIAGQSIGQGMAATPASPDQASAAGMNPSTTPALTSTVGNSTTPQIDPTKALLGALMLHSAKNANDLIAAYNFLNPNGKQSETARVDQQRTQGMLGVINTMMGQVDSAKGIGPFKDIIQHAEQKTGLAGGGDPTTIQLNGNMALLKQMIATEVHRRGMSESALKAMYDAFPDPAESHATYKQKLTNLSNIMQTYFGNFADPASQ